MVHYTNYAKDLFALGFGYPLWIPDSIARRKVEIGAVGWLQDGGFRTLFNTTGNPVLNNGLFVPQQFSRLKVDSRQFVEDEQITQPLLYSRSVYHTDAAAEVSASE